MAKIPSTEGEPTYRIGAVARLTGIAADTLRVWERRYGVVEPRRTEKGSRLYTKDDIGRLASIKRLVDAGHAIGSVANLSLDQLQDRLEAIALAPPAMAPEMVSEGPCRVAILGDALAARLTGVQDGLRGIEVALVGRDPGRFAEQAAALRPEVVVVEYPTVDEQTLSEVRSLLRKSGAQRAIVVYGFGRREVIRRLDTVQTIPVRAPIDPAELKLWCRPAQSVPVAPEPPDLESFVAQPMPPHRYDMATLSRLASASTTVKCECPRHLADLIFSLRAFEDYSTDCESSSPEDAALHAYLHSVTAHARAMLEEALARLVEAERLLLEEEK